MAEPSSSPHPPAISAIVHGLRWPDAAARAALDARLREALPDLDIIEAREDPTACLGAAAVMARAAAKARGSILIFLECASCVGADDLRRLVGQTGRGVVFEEEEGLGAGGWGLGEERGDLLARLAAIVERDPEGVEATPPHPALSPSGGEGSALSLAPRTPIVAIRRAAYDAIGGFDSRFWSVGLAEDLSARAQMADIPVERLALASNAGAPPAYPLRPAIVRLLALRNPLLTAFKTAHADALGEAFAAQATRALHDAWRASGLGTDLFEFGGSWGRGATALRSVAQRITGRASLASPLRDADGCLLPLLAIDSALDALPALLDEREAWRKAGARVWGLGSGEDKPQASSRSSISTAITAAVTDSRTSTGTDIRLADSPAPSPQPPAPDPRPQPPAPALSVIVVNWNGREHLRDCFGSLQRSDYPADRRQLICVDNGSTDGSVELLRAEMPGVTVVALDRNTGFTGGNEAGVRAATGDVLIFLNNDMRVEPDCLRELVGALDAGHACTGARVLSWDGRAIDFVRGSLNFEARGFQDFYGFPNLPELTTPTDTFFPNGGAFAVTREAYDRAGGFDPTFFAYYDDVDLGWRLRLTGTQIRVAGRAVVYHRHGATSRTQPGGQKRFLMDRNAFWTLMKNYGEPALRRTLGPALVLAIRRILDESRLDRRAPLIRSLTPFVVRCRSGRRGARRSRDGWAAALVYEDSPEEGGPPPIVGLPLEALGAVCAAVEALPGLAARRARVQGARAAADREILPRFGRTLEAVWPLSSYRQVQQALMEAEGLAEVFRARTRLLIIGHEALARHISGPAVRVLELGRVLSGVARVTIATPAAAEIDDPRCTFAAYDPDDAAGLKRLAEDADVLLVQGFTLARYPFLQTLQIPVIVDLYCPFTLEHLEQMRARLASGGADPHGERLAVAQREANGVLGVQNQQLGEGDFFICASETQRDFWIGTLHAHGRVNPLTYGDDPTLRRLIDVVPFGLPEIDLADAAARADAARGDARGQPVMRGVWPGIGERDRILLWAGSLLDWQDPITLIQAVGALAQSRADVKLVFMGTRHPNPQVSPMQVVEESRALAARLGLLDTHVFFNDWVPYEQRALFLQESDLGLSTHREHLETHFSFRTRMLDYIWAGLPIVCTRGDYFAGLVESRGLGAAVPPGDVPALAAAIARLLDDEEHRRGVQGRLAAMRGELRWSRVAGPLARYCAAPYLAADRAPALREFRQRLSQQYRESKWLKQTALRLGLSEFQFERLKQSSLGRAAMSLQTRRALQRARRQS